MNSAEHAGRWEKIVDGLKRAGVPDNIVATLKSAFDAMSPVEAQKVIEAGHVDSSWFGDAVSFQLRRNLLRALNFVMSLRVSSAQRLAWQRNENMQKYVRRYETWRDTDENSDIDLLFQDDRPTRHDFNLIWAVRNELIKINRVGPMPGSTLATAQKSRDGCFEVHTRVPLQWTFWMPERYDHFGRFNPFG